MRVEDGSAGSDSTTAVGGISCPAPPARNEAFMSVVKVLTLATTAVLGLASVTAAQDTTAAAPTPVARVVLATPRTTVVVNDSVRLEARALDANGRPLPEAKIVFKSVGPAQAQVEEDGLVRAGSVGDVPLIATAIVPGTKPYIEHLSVRIVPGPAKSVRIADAPARLVPHQRVQLGASVLSAEGDARDDRVTWSSSAPSVARVNRDGLLEARAAGRTTIRASSAGLRAELPIEVMAAAPASLTLEPSATKVRQGDVVRFTATARSAANRAITGLTPSWSFGPGEGHIDDDGAFVPYEPGTYTVTAALGGRSATAEVTVGRARGASAGHGRRRGGAEGIPHRGGLAASQRQGRVPRHPPRRRPALHHRRERPREAGRGRLGPGEHPRDQRHHDRQGGQGPGVHPRGRRRSPERNRGLHAGGPAPSEGRRRVHRGRDRRGALRVHLLAAEVRDPGLPDQRRHRRAPHRRHHRSGASEGDRSLEDARAPTTAGRCTTSTCRTGWCTPAGGTTGW